ncbi:MAG TPA: 4a-hydroxytetrahydrobiopterin dehydratase [Pseudonocardiaceae bacterium]
MSELLTEEEITKVLGSLPAWRRDGEALVRDAELDSFARAIQVVNRVAEIAENNNHHPDIDIRWRTLTFACATHSAGGITSADVSLAEEIDGILDALTEQASEKPAE